VGLMLASWISRFTFERRIEDGERQAEQRFEMRLSHGAYR
jgi:hypothetical protein